MLEPGVYFFRFETALRMKDATVAIPYWASNLDNEMEDPSKSIIWSEDFLGNGDGFVTVGSFANFRVHSTDSILNRNVGASGSLFTNEGIHGILSQNNTYQITNPGAMFQYNIEKQHNTVHRWVGGNMDDLSTSAEDPVFYLHHSFVDYLWEEFRTKQKMLGIDPETDYPKANFGTKDHAPDAPLGFGDLRNVDAIANVFADLVKYDPSPVCSLRHPTCGSKYLRCDIARPTPICVSLSREEVNKKLDDELELCVEPHLSRSVQNNFAINQFCDIRKWAYITVNVILQRPPEFVHYKAFPVIENEPVTTSDIFSTLTVQKNISKILATYPNCRKTNSVARKIFIESHGLNYYGNYKDFTVLDQRHALSSATTYIGIKSPESNYTDVILYAYDFCGRSCRPYCLDMKMSPPKSKPCAGVIRVTSDEPKLYGQSYADAVNNVWQADHADDLPEVAQHPASVTFYCDYSGAWPWDEEIQSKNMRKKPHSKRKATNKVSKKKIGNDKPKVSSDGKVKQTRIINIRTGDKPAAKSSHITKTVNSLSHIPIVRTFDLRSATSRPVLQRPKLPKSRPVQTVRQVNSNVRKINTNPRNIRRNPLLRPTKTIQSPSVISQRTRMAPRLRKYLKFMLADLVATQLNQTFSEKCKSFKSL